MPTQRRIGIYGWGVVAPGAHDIPSFEKLLRSGRTALAPSTRPELGSGLFAVGEPAFAFADYAPWIRARHGDAYATRLQKKMGENVQFTVGATIQALGTQPSLESLVKKLDDQCHVYIGSGVGDLPQSYAASRSMEKATRAWSRFWADAAHCSARRRFDAGEPAPTPAPPADPTTLPVDSDERLDALDTWNAYWAAQSDELRAFLVRYAAIERLAIQNTDDENGHLAAIRARARAHRVLADEVGCPAPPWTSVKPDLIWNIQNSPAAQITMLLDIHGASYAPVGACSTFGVSVACGMSAIASGEAKLAIVGSTDPRPDPALAAAFYDARVMPATGEVNHPFTSLRGTHVSGGACTWIIGDAGWAREHGLEALGYIEAATLASDAEHIITPSKSGPKRALARAFQIASIAKDDVAVMDLHATGTPGDLNELELVEDYVGDQTVFTARKGQLGHGMANSGGWELTALALGLARGVAYPTGIAESEFHPRIQRRSQLVGESERTLAGDVGVKMMLGIGGITACVILRGP